MINYQKLFHAIEYCNFYIKTLDAKIYKRSTFYRIKAHVLKTLYKDENIIFEVEDYEYQVVKHDRCNLVSFKIIAPNNITLKVHQIQNADITKYFNLKQDVVRKYYIKPANIIEEYSLNQFLSELKVIIEYSIATGFKIYGKGEHCRNQFHCIKNFFYATHNIEIAYAKEKNIKDKTFINVTKLNSNKTITINFKYLKELVNNKKFLNYEI